MIIKRRDLERLRMLSPQNLAGFSKVENMQISECLPV